MKLVECVHCIGKVQLRWLAVPVVFLAMGSSAEGQRVCFTEAAAQVGQTHVVTDSLCLRPRSLARETGRAGYWSCLVYEETLVKVGEGLATEFLLTFDSEEEFSPFLMYDDEEKHSLPLFRPFRIVRTKNGVEVSDASTNAALESNLGERIARMYSAPTPHEITMALLQQRCVAAGDSSVVDPDLASELFESDEGEKLQGDVTLRTVRIFDTLGIQAVEFHLCYDGLAGRSGGLEEVTEHSVVLLAAAGTADPIRITENRLRYLRDASATEQHRNITYIMRCLRFSPPPGKQAD